MDPPPPRPKLSLKFSFSQSNAGSPTNTPQSQSRPQTPSAAAPQRTPSIKFKVKPSPAPASSLPATPAENVATPGGSSKKRKRDPPSAEQGPAPAAAPKPKAPQLLKLITKNGPAPKSKSSAITPGIKLKTKGKIPRRPLGVGYDSELEDRELDPVILEAFVLRMLPGDDCEYVRECIANGSVGVSVLQKGADIRLRVLDVNGRRGILTVRGRQYAFTVVDLPTITEGMKSWDRKNFIKSVDISQMCLVLGRCNSDEEARNYPLPPDVNPKNFQYAHGLTAPMKNVRKRRFERTARARLDDIEAIERKVNSLLEADSKASSVSYEVLDYDPRHEEYSANEYDSDEDAEAEEEDGYFPPQPDLDAAGDQYTTEDFSALEAMFEEGANSEIQDDQASAATAAATAPTVPPGADGDASAAPSPAAGETPADIGTPATGIGEADADFDDDGPDNDDDDEEDEEQDQEANDEKAETLAKIKEAEDKIAQQRAQLSKQMNHILKRKIAKKIQDLESDIRMMRRHAGIREPGVDDGDGDETAQAGDGESEEE